MQKVQGLFDEITERTDFIGQMRNSESSLSMTPEDNLTQTGIYA